LKEVSRVALRFAFHRQRETFINHSSSALESIAERQIHVQVNNQPSQSPP
jgi:hypothetical protein